MSVTIKQGKLRSFFSTITIIGVSFILLLSGCSSGNKEKSEKYEHESSISVGLGEMITLDSREDEIGDQYDYTAEFDWEGVMKFQVNDVVVYKTPLEAGLADESLAISLPSSGMSEAEKKKMNFILVSITLENIDAVPSSKLSKDDFNISTFRLINKNNPDYLIESAYFDSTIKNAGEKDTYRYIIEKGEKKDMKLGYFIPEDRLNDDYLYAIGLTGIHKYLVDFKVANES